MLGYQSILRSSNISQSTLFINDLHYFIKYTFLYDYMYAKSFVSLCLNYPDTIDFFLKPLCIIIAIAIMVNFYGKFFSFLGGGL